MTAKKGQKLTYKITPDSHFLNRIPESEIEDWSDIDKAIYRDIHEENEPFYNNVDEP